MLDCATGIQNIPFTSEVSIYPNPTSNSILIDIEKSIEELTITLFDLSGKTIFETAYSNVQQLTLDLVELNNGLYFLELRNGQEVEIQKISKK